MANFKTINCKIDFFWKPYDLNDRIFLVIILNFFCTFYSNQNFWRPSPCLENFCFGAPIYVIWIFFIIFQIWHLKIFFIPLRISSNFYDPPRWSLGIKILQTFKYNFRFGTWLKGISKIQSLRVSFAGFSAKAKFVDPGISGIYRWYPWVNYLLTQKY